MMGPIGIREGDPRSGLGVLYVSLKLSPAGPDGIV
jgi:hypothetical protein